MFYIENLYLYTGKYDKLKLTNKNSKEENIDYNFRIICDQNGFYFAFCNGELMSETGYCSYRTSLRMNVLPLLKKLCEENKIINIEYTIDWFNCTHNKKINKDNIQQFLSIYEYPNIINKYGYTEYSRWLHNLIDDWNDITHTVQSLGGRSTDVYKIDAKEIKITSADVTIHEMDDRKHRNSHFRNEIFFVNGIPLDCMMNYERNFYNGLIVGESNLGQVYPTRENQINIIANILKDTENFSLISPQQEETTAEINKAKELIKSLY